MKIWVHGIISTGYFNCKIHMEKEHFVHWMLYIKSLSNNSILHEKQLVIFTKLTLIMYTPQIYQSCELFFLKWCSGKVMKFFLTCQMKRKVWMSSLALFILCFSNYIFRDVKPTVIINQMDSFLIMWLEKYFFRVLLNYS